MAALVAVEPPMADLAVIDGLGVVRGSDRFWVLEGRRFEPSTDETEVRRELLDAKALDGRYRIRGDDVEPLRQGALNPLKQIGVERELQHGSAARFLCKLRIDDLVRPRSERARALHSAEDVRPPEPPAVAKGGLEDDGN